jgi:anthranilate synthase/aminodeoxychorismate synthase-like glutamine amidotransferase
VIGRILLIDNLDSFTFNLAEAFQRLGCSVRTVRNTVSASEALSEAEQLDTLIVLSPGPGAPQGAGCCLELIAKAKGKLPVLGVCLGHQAIVAEAGGQVARAALPVHGKSTLLHHDGGGPFAGFDGPARVGRYHSLCTYAIPGRFTVHAEVDGMAMAISDRSAFQTGLQFHPESVLTAKGDRMLANILAGASS